MKIEYYGNAAYFPEIGACACADIHIGIENALISEGFSMPLNEDKELLSRFKAILDRFRPETLVLDGDVLHEFHRLRKHTKGSFDRILLALNISVEELVIVEGSHDKMMEAALSDAGIESHDFYFKGGVLFTHGDAVPARANDKDVKLIVIGHDHPMLDIEMKKVPCFLYGEKAWKGKDVLALPAFNPLCAGTSINGMDSGDFLSRFLNESDAGAFRPIINVDDETLEFPMLKEFRDILRYDRL